MEYRGLDSLLTQLEHEERQPGRTIPLNGKAGDREEVRPFGAINASYRSLFYGSDRTSIPVTEKAEEFCRRVLATRTMIAGSLADGGASVPEYWFDDVYRNVLHESVALPRVRVYPMQSNILHIPAMDSEDSSAGYIGGVGAVWQGEGKAAAEVSPKLRMLTLKTHKLAMYVSASREVIEDSGNLAGVLGNQMVYALQQTADEVILTGNGVAQPLGVIYSPARIDYTRNAAGAVSFADVAGMYARLHPAFARGAVWVGHPSIIPQLLVMADAGSHAIWRPTMSGAVEGVPGMPLLGLPLLLTDKLPALGTCGDLVLANLAQYAVGIRRGTILETTNSAYWSQDLFRFRVVMRLDGGSLLDSPITPRTGGSTLSAFVVLS